MDNEKQKGASQSAWQKLLDSLSPEDRMFLSKIVNFESFRDFYESRSLGGDPFSLWRAKQAYETPQPIEAPAEEPEKEGEGKRRRGHRPHAIIHGEDSPKDLDELEKKANGHADRREKEWDKTKDPTKAMDATHAWSLGKQEYYDNFAINHPETAVEWSGKSQNPHLSTALERRTLREEAKSKGEPSPDFSWRPPSGTTTPSGSGSNPLRRFSPKSLRQGLSNRVSSGSRMGGSMMRSLFKMLLRSLVSAASAAVGAVSAAVGAIAAAIASVIVALTGISVATIIPFLVIAIILIIIIVVVVIIAFLFPPNISTTRGANLSPYPGITYSIIAQPEEPRRAEKGQDITYKIYFFYIPTQAQTPLESITLVSTFPPEVDFVSASGVYSPSPPSPGSVRWALSQNAQPQKDRDGYAYSFDLVLRSDVDITITNSLSLEGVNFGERSQPPVGEPPPPVGGGNTGQLVTFQIGNHTVITNYRSSNDCNGKYYGKKQIDLSNTDKYPIGNFGDPNCDFSKDAVINLIKTLDPGDFIAKNGRRYKRYAVWDGIIHCESGYFPNALNHNSHSGWGAWGLFQMNPDFSGRAVHDNGTTDWRTQIENAITRNNNVSDGGFGYWGCAGGFRRGTKDPRI